MSTVFVPLPTTLGQDSHPIAAFSNGYEGDMWTGRWCRTCRHDNQDSRTNVSKEALILCPLLNAALLGGTPREWEEVSLGGLANRYACSEYDPIDPDEDARHGI